MPRKKRLTKEEISENWCYVCKDGGKLRLCDHLRCPKVYHSECVDKDESFLVAETKWTCNWHFCHVCGKASKFYCLCCPSAVCKTCLYDAQFAVVKRNKGFCNSCLELAWLIETNKDVKSVGCNIDVNHPKTTDYFFNGYWQTIKQKEGLTSKNVILAYDLSKKGEMHKRASNAFESDEGEEDIDGFEDESLFNVSDFSDSIDTEECKLQPHRWNNKRKRSTGKMSRKKEKASVKKLVQLQNPVDKATEIAGKGGYPLIMKTLWIGNFEFVDNIQIWTLNSHFSSTLSKCIDSLPQLQMPSEQPELLLEVLLELGNAQDVEPACKDFSRKNQQEHSDGLRESHPPCSSKGNAASCQVPLERPQHEVTIVIADSQEKPHKTSDKPQLLHRVPFIFTEAQGVEPDCKNCTSTNEQEHDDGLQESSPGGTSEANGTSCRMQPEQQEQEVPVVIADSQEQTLIPLQQPQLFHEIRGVITDTQDVGPVCKDWTSTNEEDRDNGLVEASPARNSEGNGTSAHFPSKETQHEGTEDHIVTADAQGARSAVKEFKRADKHNHNDGLTESNQSSYEGNETSCFVPSEQPRYEVPSVTVNRQGAKPIGKEPKRGDDHNHIDCLRESPRRMSAGNGMACHMNYSLDVAGMPGSSSPLSAAASQSHQEAVPMVTIHVKDEGTKDFDPLSVQQAFFANLQSMLYESLEDPPGSSQQPPHTPEQNEALDCLQQCCSMSFEQLMNHDLKHCFLSSINSLLISGYFPESMLGMVTSLQLKFLSNTSLYSRCLENVRMADEENERTKSLMKELAEKNLRFHQINHAMEVTLDMIDKLKKQLREKGEFKDSLREESTLIYQSSLAPHEALCQSIRSSKILGKCKESSRQHMKEIDDSWTKFQIESSKLLERFR
ncbi:hypothetical protein KPL70_013666 [Citrus sinensis]|nr:hypothetical protein KPL70_013666 [Citrus sinensis]